MTEQEFKKITSKSQEYFEVLKNNGFSHEESRVLSGITGELKKEIMSSVDDKLIKHEIKLMQINRQNRYELKPGIHEKLGYGVLILFVFIIIVFEILS